MNTIMDTLVPKQVQIIFKPVPTSCEAEKNETQVLAVAKLVIEAVRGTCCAIKQKEYKLLDPNPGDAQCQNRALEIRRLALDPNLQEQITFLEKQVNEAAKKIQLFKDSQKERRKVNMPVEHYVGNFLNTIGLSSDMAFLTHCYLGKTVRGKHYVTPSGVVVTHTDVTLLDKLSKLCSSAHRHAIINESQSLLSHMTAERMRKQASSLKNLDEREKKLLDEMLSVEQSKVHISDPKYPPKTFLCQFFAIKAATQKLLEEHAIIAIKSIVAPGEKSLTIFMQSDGQKFSILPQPQEVDPSTPVIVFDTLLKEKDESGPSTTTLTEVEEVFAKVSFVDIILANAAKLEPFQRGSTIEEISIEEARSEILSYAQKNHYFLIDHIYTSSMQKETSHAT